MLISPQPIEKETQCGDDECFHWGSLDLRACIEISTLRGNWEAIEFSRDGCENGRRFGRADGFPEEGQGLHDLQIPRRVSLWRFEGY